MLFMLSDETGKADMCRYAMHRWHHWRLLSAIDTWLSNVTTLADLRDKSDLAFGYLYQRLAAKSFAGFAAKVAAVKIVESARQHALRNIFQKAIRG
jgi:hypothetical protein